MDISIKPHLKVHTSTDISGNKYYTDISERAIGWRRSIRAQGGYWQGTFQLRGRLQDMNQVYYHWLGCKIKEITGGRQTWEGMLCEIDLTYHGVTRRRTLNTMRNHVTVFYQDNEGEAQSTTAVTNVDSIQRYGRFEGTWTMDQVSSTVAEAFAATRLKEYGWPPQTVVGAELQEPENDEAVLDIMCCGLIWTANWRFQQVGDGSLDNISDWISEILTTDCEFLEPGVIQPNTLQVYKANSQPRRCWDVMMELGSIGDADSNPWRVYCGNNGYVYYDRISTQIRYYIRGGKLRGPFSDLVVANPWTVQPAVIYDSDYLAACDQRDGWLTDTRSFYAEEVECSVDSGLTLKSSLYDEGEVLLAQLDYIRSMFKPED